MLKKVLKGMLIGGAAMTIAASSATAADVTVNIFGASAQFKFWTSAAPAYLATICENETDVLTAIDEDNWDRDAGIAVCLGATGIDGLTGAGLAGDSTDQVIIRYTTNSSYDGVMSVMNDDSFDADNCPTDGDRLQADPTAADLTGSTVTTPNETISALACMDVHVGASDVSAKTFQQSSEGWAKGPYTGLGDSVIDRDIVYGVNLQDPVDALGFNFDRPIVVPFGFFANTATPVDNLTRMMAVNIFAGKVVYWDEIDPSFPHQQITVCHRHAGSGTVATLNAAVFRGADTLPVRQKDKVFGSPYFDGAVLGGYSPAIFFNKGSSDATRCSGYTPYAISYADSDKCVGGCDGDYGDVKAIAYQGVGGDVLNSNMRTAVANGQHIFWAAQYLYHLQSGETATMIDNLVAYASIPANIPAKRAAFWAAANELKWVKADDFAWPTPAE